MIMNKKFVDRKEILARRLKELLTEKEWNNKQFCAEFNSDKSEYLEESTKITSFAPAFRALRPKEPV